MFQGYRGVSPGNNGWDSKKSRHACEHTIRAWILLWSCMGMNNHMETQSWDQKLVLHQRACDNWRSSGKLTWTSMGAVQFTLKLMFHAFKGKLTDAPSEFGSKYDRVSVSPKVEGDIFPGFCDTFWMLWHSKHLTSVRLKQDTTAAVLIYRKHCAAYLMEHVFAQNSSGRDATSDTRSPNETRRLAEPVIPTITRLSDWDLFILWWVANMLAYILPVKYFLCRKGWNWKVSTVTRVASFITHS